MSSGTAISSRASYNTRGYSWSAPGDLSIFNLASFDFIKSNVILLSDAGNSIFLLGNSSKSKSFSLVKTEEKNFSKAFALSPSDSANSISPFSFFHFRSPIAVCDFDFSFICFQNFLGFYLQDATIASCSNLVNFLVSLLTLLRTFKYCL